MNQEQISRLLTGTPSSLSPVDVCSFILLSWSPRCKLTGISLCKEMLNHTPPSSRRRQNSSWGQSLAPLNTGKNHNVYTFPLSLDSCRWLSLLLLLLVGKSRRGERAQCLCEQGKRMEFVTPMPQGVLQQNTSHKM